MSFFSNISKVVRGVQSPYNSFNATPIKASPNQLSPSAHFGSRFENFGIRDIPVTAVSKINPNARLRAWNVAPIIHNIRSTITNLTPLQKVKVK